MITVIVELPDHAIGKGLPPPLRMRMGLPRLNRQHGIEQKHPLLGPFLQMAMGRTHESGMSLDSSW